MQSAAKIDHPCSKCAFYDQSVWQPVDADSVRSLTHSFVRRDLKDGEAVFEQGADNRGFFCVSRGLIALRTHHAEGNSTLLRLAYPGDIIGFRSFLADGQHQTEARALMPSRICTVPQSTTKTLLLDNPAIMNKLAARCVHEINRTHARICSAATKTYKTQLADLLMTLMDHHGTQVGNEWLMRLPLSRSDLSDLLGVQPETLSRLIKRLEKDGNFQIKGRHVTFTGPVTKNVRTIAS